MNASSYLDLYGVSYQWLRNGTTQSETTKTLNLSPLDVYENYTVYRCRYRAISLYLTEAVNIQSNIIRIFITGIYAFYFTCFNNCKV